MRRQYRYRLYPNRAQVAALEQQLSEACDLYNAALQHRRDSWARDSTGMPRPRSKRWARKSNGQVDWGESGKQTEDGISVKRADQSSDLTELRREGVVSTTANMWSQQAVLRRLDLAFAAFFRRVKAGETPGYPRFRSRRRYDTLDFTFAGHAGGVAITDAGRLRVQGVGHIKIKMHRPLPAGAKLCEARITRYGGRWYVSLMLDNVAANPLPAAGRNVGVDVGITTFAATSDTEKIKGPRANRAAAARVRRAQRKVSRRKRGSNRRRKAGALLGEQRRREKNIRRDHAHKTARELVERYDLIAVEKLNILGLAKGINARDCNDQGWGAFIALLDEKAEEAARELVRVNPNHTSQACSACGTIVPKKLKDREHSCACGYKADRDVNAARNILLRALDADAAALQRRRWAEDDPVAAEAA